MHSGTHRFARLLGIRYAWFTLGFAALLATLTLLEMEGFPRNWIGYLFMGATVVFYASIGIMSRTSEVSEYYVAGRRVPALFNGMATAADWMSAATFISLAGGIYLQGFDGLAYIMGWTGGYCLVALLIAPYLRRFGQYTIPDFLAARFADHGLGNVIRTLAVVATILVSFTYVVAQIYGVGLITSRFTGVDFSVGVFLGLASVLVCSYLGGMRAITWTQIAQYIVLLIAYLTPVIWLSAKHTHDPIPAIAYGKAVKQLEQREQQLRTDASEQQVRAVFRQRAEELEHRLQQLPQSWNEGRDKAEQHVQQLKAGHASLLDIRAAERELAAYPHDPEEARKRWEDAYNQNLARAEPVIAHAEPFPGKTEAVRHAKRDNFLALALCLMMGTAALPHILVRFYTTPSVSQTRHSAFATLFFISLVYLTIPALAVLVKLDIYTSLVGSRYSALPEWVSYWAHIDSASPLVQIQDINGDGIVQLGEIVIDGDIVVLATPEIAGLPYVISGLIAAGGLAAALSTADGLLLTISNGLSHDIYYRIVNPGASTRKRVTISKLLLLVVALIAAYAASMKPGDILSVVGAAFSLAASSLFPALVMGVFSRRATAPGAMAGILTGSAVCAFYLVHAGSSGGNHMWFNIAPISAGVFGVPAGFAAIALVSRFTGTPSKDVTDLLQQLRTPPPTDTGIMVEPAPEEH